MATTTENLVSGFAQLPGRNKLGFIFGLAALMALIAGAFLWGRTPNYQVLYSNLSDRDGGAIVSALGQLNVPYKFAEGGGAILVPSEMVHEARLRLASQGLPKGSIVGFELLESQKLGVTQFQEHVNYQRGLEGELARSIQSLAAVQSARVHLAIPKSSVFLREQQKPTASVLVALHPGRSLDRAQVAGIVHLVASSVPQLSPKSVSVLDQSGNLFAAVADGSSLNPQQLSYVQELEGAYIRRIQDILEPIVGRENVKAQVSAEIDFSQSESTAEIYKPNGAQEQSAMRSQSVAEAGTGGAAQAQGVPGAASNQPGAAAPASTTAGSNGKKESTTNYEVDKTVRHVKTPVGSVRRLSAAIVVNHRKVTGADGKVTVTALKKEELDQLTALAKEAMGFSETRGDSLNLANAVFNVEDREIPPALPIWQQPENIALAKDIGKGFGAVLLILYVLLAIVRPLIRQLSAPPVAPQLLPAQDAGADDGVNYTPGPANRLENAKQLAQQDPRVVANVVRNWVAEP